MQKIDLKSAKTIIPEAAEGSELSPLKKAGFRLATYTILVIAGYLIFILLPLLWWTDIDSSSYIIENSQKIIDYDDDKLSKIVEALSNEKKYYRDFVIQMSQMILLNLLLPILTAILGYIFGSKEDAQK